MIGWTTEEAPSERDVAVLADGVLRFGRSKAVGGNPRPLACFLREHDQVVAGASGRIEFDRLFISYLWVAEQRRGSGLGQLALSHIEDAARERGGREALIETLSDRTAALYRRVGYRPIAGIERYVGAFTKHVMVKPLAAAPQGPFPNDAAPRAMDVVLAEADRQALTRLEEAMWREDTRFDMSFMETALAPDFFEFGRSGRTYTRGQTLAASRHFIDSKLPLPDLKIRLLDRDTAHVTYNSEVTYDGITEHGRRSSIWSRTESSWVLRFHQGTPYVP